eukprot:gene34811-45025_t
MLNCLSSSVRSIAKFAFKGSGLSNITVPTSVSSIDEFSFASAVALRFVFLSTSVTAISASSFFNCEKLKSIFIPTSVVRISSNAFESSGLLAITVPGSVTMFEGAFSYALALKKVILSTYLTVIPASSFFRCVNLTSIVIPTSVGSIEEFAFAYTGLRSVYIPSSVTYLSWLAFWQTAVFNPTTKPSKIPSQGPSVLPSGPSIAPSGPSRAPSLRPSGPSRRPTTGLPSTVPSKGPTFQPTACVIIGGTAVENDAY